jgi:signal transduction histidine kinase
VQTAVQIFKSLLEQILGSSEKPLQESQDSVQAPDGSRTGSPEPAQEEPSEAAWLSAVPHALNSDQGMASQTKKQADAALASPEVLRRKTIAQMNFVQDFLEELSNGFNKVAASHKRLKALHITSARFSKHPSPETNPNSEELPRYRLTCGMLSVIVTGGKGVVEIFELPADQLFLAAGQERVDKRRLVWNLQDQDNLFAWYADGLPLDASSRQVMLKQLFFDFVKAAWHRQQDGVQTESLAVRRVEKEQAITVQNLIEEKQNLVNKLLSRDEELTSAIARDLHDVVIADIMLLKGRLTCDPVQADKEEILDVLDRLTKRLREICYNLTPRDLADWGLKTVLEDLAHQFGKKNDANCTFVCIENLPAIEHAVQLQIYRIVQEGLNNVAKYAEAKNVSINLSVVDGTLKVSVEDDGKGFEVDEVALQRSTDGGSGLHDLRERTELIRCFHPARLAIVSEPGHGTSVTVEINLLRS